MSGSSRSASPSGSAPRHPTLWLFDTILGALLALLLAPPLVALSSLPWNAGVTTWTLPAACAIGFGLGALGSLLPLSPRSLLAQLLGVPALGGAAVAGALLAASAAGIAHLSVANTLGATLLGAYAGLLGALTPWLFFRMKQPWLSIVVVWVTVAGIWRGGIGSQQVWWVIILLALSLLTLGLRRLREEMAIWLRDDLQRLGAVFWPSARAILAITLIVATVGLVPLAAQLGVLSALWNRTPLGQKGPLPFDSPSGTPDAALGAPLGLTSPDISGNQIVLTYQLLSVPSLVPGASGATNTPGATSAPSAGAFTTTPPLLGATFDAFNGETWTQSARLTTVAAGAAPSASSDLALQARITLRNLPRTNGQTFLLGFDQPVAFSVPAQARVTDGASPAQLNVASWGTTAALGPGDSYTTTSIVVGPVIATPTTPPPPLDPAQAARLEATPPALQAQLHALAAAWATGATTPQAQADAVLTGLRGYAQLDATAAAPAGSDGVQWFLQQKRGNVLQFTTAYILLCRSIGLPMRLAEGYLPGAYDTGLRAWVVRSSDAAVWAQLALPGVGWLDYFPAGKTVTLTIPSTIIHQTAKPTQTPTPQSAHGTPQKPFTRVTQNDQSNTARTVALLGGALLLALLCALALLAWRWSRLGAGLDPLTRFFARVAALARIGGVPLRSSDTAKQATNKVAARVPQETDTLLALNTAYERMRYGPPLMRSALTNLGEQWQKVRGPLMRLVVSRPWRRPPASSSATTSRGTSRPRGAVRR